MNEAATQTEMVDIKEGSVETIVHYCEICQAGPFNTMEQYDLHMEAAVWHGPRLDCMECNLVFNNQVELLQHIQAEQHQSKWALVLLYGERFHVTQY